MGGCRCSFRSCPVSTTRNPGMHFFHYPLKQKERFAKWIKMTGSPQCLTIPTNIVKNRVVCARHFRIECFMNYKYNRLVPNEKSIPTLFRLNSKMALDFEHITENTGPKLIQLEEPTMLHLIPPADYVCPFTMHDNLPDNFQLAEMSTNNLSTTKLFPEQSQQKTRKRISCSPPSNGPNAKVIKILNSASPINIHSNSSNATAESVVYLNIDLNDLEEKSIEDTNDLNYILDHLEETAKDEKNTLLIESRTEKLITKNQHVSLVKHFESQLEDMSNEHRADMKRLISCIRQLENTLKDTEQTLQEKVQQLAHSEAKFADIVKKNEDICKENILFQKKYSTHEEGIVALRTELQLLQEANDILEQKCSKLELQRRLQMEAVTSSAAIVPNAAAKQSLTKGQLFNNIKKYLSASMTALLRMEMFGSAERDWKPDERRVAMNLLQLGENVYKYITDEWRIRLPAMRLVRDWSNAEDPDLDEEDL